MTSPLAIYEQACADIEKLALDHGITRAQAAGLMIDALRPALNELTSGCLDKTAISLSELTRSMKEVMKGEGNE
jgi:hypothetical protein